MKRDKKIVNENVESEISRLNNSLRERIKELAGICSLAKLTDETNNLNEIFSRFVKEIVPPSIQFPERAVARIVFDDKVYINLEKPLKIKNREVLRAPIIVMGKQRGQLIVTYTEDSSFIALFEQNLIDSYAEWLGKIIERIEALEEVTSTRDQLRRVINSASEVIVSVDSDGTIINWNNAIANLTGIQKRELLRKNIYQKKFPDQIAPLIENIISSLKKGKNEVLQIQIKDKHKTTRTILCSISPFTVTNKEKGGLVLIGRDITANLHLQKQIVPGNAYIAYDKSFHHLAGAYEGFSNKEYSLLFISRELTSLLQAKSIKHTETIMLAARKKNMPAENRLDAILDHLVSVLEKKKTFVIIDRLDYLCSVHGFEEVIKFLYEINDIIRMSDNIAIIQISSQSFSMEQKSRLEDEFFLYPEIKPELSYLDEEKMMVLKFIANKNSFHQSVYYEIIKQKFSISKKLTKKWLGELESEGLVRTEKKGRRKIVTITDKAIEMIKVTD